MYTLISDLTTGKKSNNNDANTTARNKINSGGTNKRKRTKWCLQKYRYNITTGRLIYLKQGKNYIGTSENADIQSTSKYCDKWHCVVIVHRDNEVSVRHEVGEIMNEDNTFLIDNKFLFIFPI